MEFRSWAAPIEVGLRMHARNREQGGSGTMMRAALLVSIPALAMAFLPSGGVPGLRSHKAGAYTSVGLRTGPLSAASSSARKALLRAGRASPVMMGNAVNNPDFQYLTERDACGVGFVATRKGEPIHDVVAKVRTALQQKARRALVKLGRGSSDEASCLSCSYVVPVG
jgi:hypothetical protein